jgi:hypothetical protein
MYMALLKVCAQMPRLAGIMLVRRDANVEDWSDPVDLQTVAHYSEPHLRITQTLHTLKRFEAGKTTVFTRLFKSDKTESCVHQPVNKLLSNLTEQTLMLNHISQFFL